MVLALILAAAVTQSVQAQPLTTECPVLVAGKPVSVIIPPAQHACVQKELSQGEAAQAIADHVGDLALRVTGPTEFLTDGFEFDRETVTLSIPGRYRIEIVNRDKDSAKSSVTVPMLRNPIPLQAAAQWQQAELSATASKQSMKIKDISASLELWQALGDASSIARTWLKLGDAKLSNDPSGARDAYEQAFRICHWLNELRCIAEAANNSGLTARQLGDFNGSLDRLQEAARTWETLHLPILEALTFSNLGVRYTRTGNFQQAVNNYNRALVVLKMRDALPYARTLSNLGLCYLSFAQYDRGAGYFQKAIEIEKTLNDQAAEMSSISLSVVDRAGHPVSGLVLPYQLAGIPMNGSIVVLSACDTALGKKVLGEGMIGLTSSLFSAGASHLVLTLSKVNAEATSVFLSETYSHFFAPGFISMEHSLTLARQMLQKSDRWSDPYYWASFVEIGAPTPAHRRHRNGAL